MPVNRFDDYYLSYMPKKEALLPSMVKNMAADLEARIISGELAAHTKLPPQRELADFLDVNLSTVTRAYKLCEQKGLIYGVSGSGTFVSPNARQKLEIFRRASGSCIELGLLEPFYDCNELVAQAARSVINRQGALQLFEYADPLGSRRQLEAARSWLTRFGVQTTAENLIISSGSQNALTIALLSLFSPGDKLAADAFTYANLRGLAGMLHIQLVPIEGDAAGMLPEELERAARQQKLSGVYLMPDCANPTAITMPPGRREALVQVLRRHGLILLEDDGYSWLESGLPRMHSLMPERTVYIHSTSKSLCAGLRVSFTVFPDCFRTQMTNGILNINLKSVALNAEIVSRIICSDLADQLMQRKRTMALERGRIFAEYFPDSTGQLQADPAEAKAQKTDTASYVSPYSFFRFPALPPQMSAGQFEARALARGVHVLGSQRFLIAPQSRQAYVRVALTSPRSTEELRRGLAVLRELMAE